MQVLLLSSFKISLSFVGSVFFSAVSAFFSLFLSNVVTSEISGLSKKKKKKKESRRL